MRSPPRLLDRDGRPRSRWWPVAFAFQRINDPRAATVLLDLFNGEGQLTRAFAARGLAVTKDQRAAAPLLAAAEDAALPLAVRIQAVRGIAALGDARGGAVMRRLITSPRVDQNLQLEAITALAQLRDPAAVELLIDLVSAAVAVRAGGGAQRARAHGCRHVHQLDLRTRSGRRIGRCAPSLATTLGELGARARARRR